MHLELKASSAAPLPPWKQELLLRRSALARTVEPKLNEILNKDTNQVDSVFTLCTMFVQTISDTFTHTLQGPTKEVASMAGKNGANKQQRPLTGKSVNGTCSQTSGGGASSSVLHATLSLSKAGPLSPSPPSWRLATGELAGPGRLLQRMTTDKVVTLQPSQRDDHLSFNALSTKRILVDPKVQQPSIDRNKMGEDTMSSNKKFQCGSGGSDSDSDSSEDLQYGPGFVSKLKSRYMSAAFKSSALLTSGLRRTASLEDFLDKDKEEVSIELKPRVTTKFQKKNEADSR